MGDFVMDALILWEKEEVGWSSCGEMNGGMN